MAREELGSLSVPDVVALLRIVGAERPAAPSAAHVLDGLCKLLPAKGVDVGNVPDSQSARAARRRLAAHACAALSSTRVGLDGGDRRLCCVIGPATRLEFQRDPHDRPFGDREIALVGAMAGADWLRPDEPSKLETGSSRMVASLPPRQHEVLDRLRNGDSGKELAKAMGITVHTAKEHVKRLFKRFNVNSRPELIARLFCGDEVTGAFDRSQAVRGCGPRRHALQEAVRSRPGGAAPSVGSAVRDGRPRKDWDKILLDPD